MCKKAHKLTTRGGMRRDSTRFSDCPEFEGLPKEDKAAQVDSMSGCPQCLDWMGQHQADDCRSQLQCKG